MINSVVYNEVQVICMVTNKDKSPFVIYPMIKNDKEILSNNNNIGAGFMDININSMRNLETIHNCIVFIQKYLYYKGYRGNVYITFISDNISNIFSTFCSVDNDIINK